MAKISFPRPISEQIWDQKYRLKAADGRIIDRTIGATFRRVARAAARVEKKPDRKKWEKRFFDSMADFSFLPGGRILAGAGSGREVTLFNCFVMGRIEDDLSSIFDNVKEAALTMQKGGGIGHDFSTLRPSGAPVGGVGSDASGPVSFMDVWDAMCRTIMSAGSRRGAMMGTLRCDHPDIEAFIEAKSRPDRLRMFNLSVLVTDAFIKAVKADRDWDLVFDGQVYKTLRARDLWDKMMRATYEYAEPGVIFIDRINSHNNLGYLETISTTNPCGEQPLPPYGACLLGSVNLVRFVTNPFEKNASLDLRKLRRIVRNGVRFLDNVIDISKYPLEMQSEEAMSKRRIGLGVTGLADALTMCGVRYGTTKSAKLASRWMAAIERYAYTASADIARSKGAFPLYDRAAYLSGPAGKRLDEKLRKKIKKSGLRNGLLTSIAPTGTISLLAGNVSSGVEPVFDLSYGRNIIQADGSRRKFVVEDYAYSEYLKKFGEHEQLPDFFVTAHEVAPIDHLRMQAALQDHVDSSISKTINCPSSISFDAFKDLYMEAYRLGLKGCTTYRPNPVTGAVLVPGSEAEEASSRPTGERRENGLVSRIYASGGDEKENDSDSVVYMSEPLERHHKLGGATYKLKWPQSDHAYYITINDIESDGRRRPFEIFINSKNLEHYAWTVALTRMISAVFRRGGDVSFVVDELRDVFDPRGGHWINGRYVPSLLAAIGDVVGRHMVAIGFISEGDLDLDFGPDRNAHRSADLAPGHDFVSDAVSDHDLDRDTDTDQRGGGPMLRAQKYCPKCHSPSFTYQEGCWVCRNCGHSKCS